MPATHDQLAATRKLLGREPLEYPDGISDSKQITMFDSHRSMRSYGRYGMRSRTAIPFHGSLMEQQIERLKKVSIQDPLPPNSYFAILKENPPVDIGVTGTREISTYHVLIGYY